MARAPFLEDFDEVLVRDEVAEAPSGPSADYLAGLAEGRAAGLAEAAAEEDRLRADLVRTFADMSFGYAEARRHVLTGLQPLFAAIVEGFLPDIAEAAMAPRLRALLQAAAETDGAAPVEIAVHPSQRGALEEALAGWHGMPVTIREDAGLGPGEAFLATATQETALDLDALRDAMQAALRALFDDLQPRTDHG